MKKFTTRYVLPGVLLALGLVVACGGSAATSVPPATNVPASNSGQAASTSAPAQPTNAPAPGGIVTATPESSDAVPNTSATAFTKINLNTATAEQILTIPNTGNRMVREFQEYRPYTSIQQFRREIGKYVDDATVAGYEKYVYVPVNVNQADAETLKQIPGITDEIAAQLIAGRPYGTNQNFLAKLITFVDASTIETAQHYLATP
jgi:DNA uptake protein ComE-like DNA-binding protein